MLKGRASKSSCFPDLPLSRFHPVVQEWFTQQFPGVTEPQRLGWPVIQSGEDVLISAPTGSGKTLAAFLHALDELVRSAAAGELTDETRILYVSPLKALSNDMRVNLEIPLAGIAELARAEGAALPEIRAAVRTGDTPMAERALMIAEGAAHLGDNPGIVIHFVDGGEVAADAALGAHADRG